VLVGRIKYRRDWKFVFREEEDAGFLRIVDGSSVLHMRPTDRLIMYKRDFMLAPLKPGKIISHDFRYIKPTTSTINPYAPILIPEKGIKELIATPSIYIVAGDEEKPVFAWGLALNITLRHYRDVRDFAMDTFYIMTEFMNTDPYEPISYRITIEEEGRFDIIDSRTLPLDPPAIHRRVGKYFLLYPQDFVSVDMDWSIVLHPGSRILMESPLGNLETKVEFKG